MTSPAAHTKTDPLRWNLADLYSGPDDERLGQDLAAGRELAEAFAQKYRRKVAQLSPKALAEALGQYEQLMDRAYRPQLYASLLFSGQTDDEAAQALLSRTREATTEAFNEVKFFDVELKKAPDDVYAQFLSAPELERYRHFLQATRRFAPYTLSEAEERLVDLKALTGRAAFTQLYTEVTGRIRIPLELDGKVREVTVAEARALRSSPDREVRRRATDGLMSAFEAQSHVLNFCFNTLFQDHRLEIEARGYANVTDPTFLEDELSPDVVEALMSATERHYHLAQRYMRLKANVLGLSDFSSHDLLAPLEKSEKKVPFEQGRAMVLDAFARFEPRFAEIAQEFFDRRWIDVLPRPGKRDGAFCSGMLPSLHPYVLLNYNERIEDVSTIAHELGHGIHFYLSRRQSPLNFWPTTPLAETASVFGELLLMRRLMEAEKDVQTRRNLLGVRIEDILSTVFNQVAYTRWEMRAHAKRAEGVVPAEEFSKLWMEERTRLYGDSVKMFPRDRWGWISIPHFVNYRFYCYSYAFGQLLVLALFGRYEEEGSAFIPRYVELLSSGSSDTPQALLSRVGLDITQPAFWDAGFKTVSALIDEFEKLVG
ncbi:MAG: M3 family oligoendopeptidase [Myxococcaceae bacterium]|nr:M3 family oligoendopeptidase [Myxococcaceae bacterium]